MHIAAIQQHIDAGFDEVYVAQIGPDQQGMLDFYAREVVPHVGRPSRPVGRENDRVTVYALGSAVPRIDASAYIHPDATVVGDVVIGPESSVWARAVVRGDAGRVRIGARSSVQDGAVVHSVPGCPTVVGDDVTIGHLSVLRGCRLEDGTLVGSGASVLPGALVCVGAVVASGAVVPRDLVVPQHETAVGAPATLSAKAFDPRLIRAARDTALAAARRHRTELRSLD